jgi:hypothetical protein
MARDSGKGDLGFLVPIVPIDIGIGNALRFSPEMPCSWYWVSKITKNGK